MDKNAIKKYAVWARNELIARVSQKAQQYGITAEGYGDKNADSVNGVLLSATEKKQSSFIKWIKIKVILNQARQTIDSHAKIRITHTNEYSRYANLFSKHQPSP